MFVNLKDIMEMYQCGKNTASKIRQCALRMFDGKCWYDSRKTKKEAVIKAFEYLGGK